MNIPMDPPSAIRGGEAFLARVYDAIRSAASPQGSNAYNTLFFIGWDEPGGTYDHVPPGPVPPPDPSAPAGQLGFTFDRSGYRVPAIIVSPWVDEGIVINDEHRHTSMIATLRKVWGLGDAFTARDAAAAPFDHLLSRESPRDPSTWPDVQALPVSQFHMDMVQMGKAFSILGKTAGAGMVEHAQQAGLTLPPELTDPNAHPSTEQIIAALRSIGAQISRALPPHRTSRSSLRPRRQKPQHRSEPHQLRVGRTSAVRARAGRARSRFETEAAARLRRPSATVAMDEDRHSRRRRASRRGAARDLPRPARRMGGFARSSSFLRTVTTPPVGRGIVAVARTRRYRWRAARR